MAATATTTTTTMTIADSAAISIASVVSSYSAVASLYAFGSDLTQVLIDFPGHVIW
jgi:hypothetical protein